MTQRKGSAMTRLHKITAVSLLGAALLAGCGDSYGERALTGAGIGAGVGAATGNDIGTSAAVGAGAGILTK
ncbi:hypothetical protein BV392_08295 [Rhodovulum sulfidophilum]|nr:hypothetical protein BV392_08295 [Rhodovulum sulfidophilum]